ncbi:MAG: ABC transporter ATP-binding protein [Geminicoccaceae bacterium]
MLELKGVESGYGETRVLHGIDLSVQEGRIHALLGRNGVGRSTTLKTIIGHLPVLKGSITFDGIDIASSAPYENARRRIAFVPETRDVFGALTVRENLELAGRLAGPEPDWTIERVVAFFPNLAERLSHGGQDLSGGEQQMLAIARALMMSPRILILDEPTEGLAPIIIQQIFSKLEELKADGLTVLLVEQNLNFALSLADDVSLMSRGEIVWHGDAGTLSTDDAAQTRYLGV